MMIQGIGGKFGLFVSANKSDGDKEETDISTGFEHDSDGFTVGMDYLLNPTTVLGIALGYGSATSDFDNNGGSLDTDTTTISFYGTKFINNSWFADGVIGIGDSDYVNKRNLAYTAVARR